MSALPTKDELAEIRAALKEANATAPTAEGFAVKAFANGDFTPEQVESWIAAQQIDAPKQLWGNKALHGIPDPDDPDSVNTNRANGKTPNPFTAAAWNVTEQGRLVKLNPKMAAGLAQAAGVRIGSTRPAAK